MNQKMPPLSLPSTSPVGENAFDGDVLNRKLLADQLTGYLDRLRAGAVLAIDAPWGEGKSWFGRNWAKHLQTQGHKCIYIDAFKQDYIEDPFMLITAELTESFGNKKDVKDLRGKAADVMKTILPIGTKAMINMAGRLALGTSGLAGEFSDAAKEAANSGADIASEWVEKKLEAHKGEKDSVERFRIALTEFANKQDSPVVVFVDELDRCRPTFAVKLIERLKHFFDVPNLVFVLLLNRSQLEKAVKGVYGADYDAATYLGKFVNFFFHLPKRISTQVRESGHMARYVEHVFDRYEFQEGRQVGGFCDVFSMMATLLNLSLREIEQGIALYAFAYPVNIFSKYLAYIIAIKVNKPALFDGLVKGETSAYLESKEIVQLMMNRLKDPAWGHGQRTWSLLNDIADLHLIHIKNDGNLPPADHNLHDLRNALINHNRNLNEAIPFLAKKIDLPIN